jgi:uncharacterized RDD family membrane protein YckC
MSEYKGLRIRFGAQIFDGIVVGIIFILLLRTLSYLIDVTRAPVSYLTDFLWGPYWNYDQLMLFLVIGFLYFFLLEGFAGMTFGKTVLKIKVAKEGGGPCGLTSSLIRNVLRIIDVLPFLYIVGMILVTRSSKRQRFGDAIAHTVVVARS